VVSEPSPSAPTDAQRPGGAGAEALPVDAVLGELRTALDTRGVAVLQAPPGAGKTTRVPLDLLANGLRGRLVVLEPRRVAARAAARRLADQLGEHVGATVGLTTRDERRTSPASRIEVVTEGVLLRRLQRDPALDGIGVLMFDEFHERNLEADLALAFAMEVRTALRPDLRILIASATLQGARVARLLGDGSPAPIVTARGRQHAVEVDHRERPDRGQLSEAVATAVVDVLAAGPGDVLAFLPGAAEIRRTARVLGERLTGGAVDLHQLHGALPTTDQDAALAPAPHGRRKVVLSTDLAESSLTIPGVRAVVDAGLSREPRFDAATGMTGLVTVPTSRASAEQRAGRAGRTAPGRALRLWPAREHPARDAHPRPAIATDDLTPAALEVAVWGAEVAALPLLDQPPAAAWERAMATLAELGAVDADGRPTPHGRELARLPVHPRLGHLLLRARGTDPGLARLATEVAAVLGDRDLFVLDRDHPVADIAARVRVLRGEPAPAGTRVHRRAVDRARREAARLGRLLALPPGPSAAPADAAGRLVALGWPDRVAARRPDRRGAFVLAGGRGADLPEADLLASEQLLAVAHLDRGTTSARIHLAAPIDEAAVRSVLAERITTTSEVAWRDGDVQAEAREELGAIVLSRVRLADPPADQVYAALLDGLRVDGVELLTWSPADRQLQARVALLRRELGPSWPPLDDGALLNDLDRTVGPFLLRARRRADLARIRAGEVLRSQLSPQQLTDVERLVPTHLTVPSGSRIRLDYSGEAAPVLAVRVQELFGSTRTPAVVDGRVPVLLHLLSPASRPVQVTDDLAGFWERGYPQVRSELRGRYPRHAWPEDPRRAEPRRGTRRRPAP
jgi:ATP-dependent helicase HrpB